MSNFSTIRLLPEHLIDQIKAGEVVERPASLIKEILENSLDAGAKHLDLHIIDNGLSLISLEDDGVGMGYEDLPYAFARHATSKIYDYADLFKLSSYGFRGEALASIASISRLSCTSAKADGHGGKIEIHGGETISHTAIEGGRKGTSLFVRDLFYNTPARLKFVKSKTSEKNALKRTIDAFLLTAPNATFSIRYDEQDKKLFPICKDELDFVKRLERVLFKRKELNNSGNLLYESRRDFEGHKLQLHVSTSPVSGTSGKQHFLFANSRLYNEKRFHQLITRSLKNLWGHESGHYACFLKVPADQIDVNVHPNKVEVKFMREDIIFALLKDALKDLDALGERVSTNLQVPTAEVQNSHQDWQRFENQTHTPTINHESATQDSNEYKVESLPIGYSWHPSHANTIISENALVKIVTQQIPYDAATSFVPLLINEPIKCHNRELNLDLLLQHGFEVQWIDQDLLALRAVSSWLRPLPYVELCRHAIQHYERLPGDLYHDLELTSKIPESVIGRMLAKFSIEELRSKNIVFELNTSNLRRLFT